MSQGAIGYDELVPPSHHLNWDKAFEKALQDAAEKDLESGEKAQFDVRFEVSVTRTNPGWADGYKVVLTRK